CSLRCARALCFFLVIRLPASSTLFPYTTLFRSQLGHVPGLQKNGSVLLGGGQAPAHGPLLAPGALPLQHDRRRSHLAREPERDRDRKSTRLNSSHEWISYAVFCLKKKNQGYTYQ